MVEKENLNKKPNQLNTEQEVSKFRDAIKDANKWGVTADIYEKLRKQVADFSKIHGAKKQETF